ncbi:hypothetical protein ABZ626_17920 [Streptomyces longispororuber]|uniref:hypothetical protein n=1 Tax=Streptomyces TaxID=1883 RepID=UPI0024A7E170|nr:hypothetical protein [Streptomyces sp. CC224B]
MLRNIASPRDEPPGLVCECVRAARRGTLHVHDNVHVEGTSRTAAAGAPRPPRVQGRSGRQHVQNRD